MPDIFLQSTPVIEKPTVSQKPEETALKDNTLSRAPITTARMFASFVTHPGNVSFQGQEAGEELLLLLRRHFVTNLSWLLAALILSLLPVVALPLFSSMLEPFFASLPPVLPVVLLGFYYAAIFSYCLVNFLIWFYNTMIITNKKVVDIDFSDLVYHDVAVTRLQMLEDVHYSQAGVIRSFFNYGDVYMQTASDKPNFEALGVPNPHRAADLIAGLIGKEAHGS